MKEAKHEIDDVEREGGDEAYLTNDTIRSLTWDIDNVEVGHRFYTDLKPCPLISNINGAAMAGNISPQARIRPESSILLFSCRRIDGHHGTFGVGQDDLVECTRSSKCLVPCGDLGESRGEWGQGRG